VPHRSLIALAPPPLKLTDGVVVPIDIARIDARLRFDGILGNRYDSTVHFAAGIADGFPVFDLRQAIWSAFLDHSPVAIDHLPPEALGLSGDSGMLVMRRLLAANTTHVFRVTGPLRAPQVRLKNRPPTVKWDGPRLTFRFGFTDRLSGRYLESWIPANFIFDEFHLSICIDLQQTHVPHVLITTGNARQTGFNSWVVDFPSACACSPLLEIHAADRVECVEKTVRVPRNSSQITAWIWKETSDNYNRLSAGADVVASSLIEYSDQLGPYVHGDRFVCILDALGSGMEYAGGMTADVSSIRHEMIHSWWGRGVRPSSQSDSWIDEAIATWFEYDSPQHSRIDSAVTGRKTLVSNNLWTRTTPGEAYSQGRNVIQHLASLLGAEQIKSYLRELFLKQLGEPLTTAAFESFLLSRFPDRQSVIALHRHIHGFPDHTDSPRLEFLRDSSAICWDDSSITVRSDSDAESKEGGTAAGQKLDFCSVP